MKVKELIAELQMYDSQMEVRIQFEVLGALNIVDVNKTQYVEDIPNDIRYPIVLLNVEHEGSFKNYMEANKDADSNT